VYKRQLQFCALRASRGDSTYERKLSRFTTPRLLIVDDLGLRPLEYDEPMDLYEIIRQRYSYCGIASSLGTTSVGSAI
jgi:DNA replication protein DnaC